MKPRKKLNKKYGFKIRAYPLIMKHLSRLLANQELRIPHITAKAISLSREQTAEEKAQRMSVPLTIQFAVEYRAVDTQEVITEVGKLVFKR